MDCFRIPSSLATFAAACVRFSVSSLFMFRIYHASMFEHFASSLKSPVAKRLVAFLPLSADSCNNRFVYSYGFCPTLCCAR